MSKINLDKFIKLCQGCESNKRLADVFDLFLTDSERDAISRRYSIVKELLAEDMPQRDIATHLNVSIAKITRGSNEIKRLTPEFKKYLKTKLK